MPEKRLREGKSKSIRDWIKENGGRQLYGAFEVFMLEGEPIVLEHEEFESRLYCSDRQADYLENHGMVDFLRRSRLIL